MRKNTKLRAGALAIVCAYGVSTGAFAAPIAFAQGPQAAAGTQPSNGQGQPSLVDFTKKDGAITVHKYAFDPAKGPAPQAKGSTEQSANEAVQGKTALTNAKFTLFKVMDITNEESFKAAIAKATNTDGTAKKPEGTVTSKTDPQTGVTTSTVTNAGTQVGQETETANGKAQWNNLPVGLYAVYETQTPKDADGTNYKQIDPYYVFLPTTFTPADDAAGATDPKGLKQWNYDVHTFPKDAKEPKVTKSVDDVNQNVGDTIVYHIDSEIPDLPAKTDSVTYFQFEDFLEKENAEIVTTEKTDDAINDADFRKKFSVEIINAEGKALQVLPADSFQTPVLEDTTKDKLPDDEKNNDYNGADSIQHTTVTLNNKGLYWLTWWKQNYKGVKVRLNIPAEVKKVESTDGHEVNDAGVRQSIVKLNKGGYEPPTPPTNPPSNPPTPPATPPTTPPSTPPGTPPPTTPNPPTPPNTPPGTPPGTPPPFIPSNDVHTYWGKVVIEKEDAIDHKKLAGATFQLFYCTPEKKLLPLPKPEKGYEYATKKPATEGEPAPIVIKGVKEWTTGTDGTVVIDGIHVNDFSDNKAFSEENKLQLQNYCLVETKAPVVDGQSYELLTEPIPFQISKTSKLENTQVLGVKKTVENHKSNVFRLPNTGGMGVALLIAFGAGVAALGAVAARRNTKKA